MNPERVAERRLPVIGSHSPARLQNFGLEFNKISRLLPGAASANIVPCFNRFVDGVLYQLVDSSSIEVMDPFENSPADYAREVVVVQLLSAESNEMVSELAWTYIAKENAIQEGLKPTREYMGHLLASPYMSNQERSRLSKVQCLDA